MSATGLDIFDKTLQTTHIWLDELMQIIGVVKHTAWHVLGAVLQTLRDRLPLGLTIHLGAQLPCSCGDSTTINGVRGKDHANCEPQSSS